MDTIQDIVPALSDVQKAHAHLRYELVGMMQVGHTNIPVQGLTMCWTCRKDFMGMPFVWYCSDWCEGKAQMNEDQARDA